MLLALLPLLALAGFDHDHRQLASVLEGAVSPAGVDYGVIAQRRAALDAYLGEVASAPVGEFSKPEQLAFYINAYNALTLRLMLDEGPPASIMDLDGGKVWDTRRFAVAGQQLTLNQIEHEHVRKIGDGRIHAAVNCASKGCPPLPAVPATPARIEAHLTDAARTWAVSNAYRWKGDALELSEIFSWYGADFTSWDKGDLPGVEGAQEGAVWFLIAHLPEDQAARLRQGAGKVDWMPYDWSLNQR